MRTEDARPGVRGKVITAKVLEAEFWVDPWWNQPVRWPAEF